MAVQSAADPEKVVGMMKLQVQQTSVGAVSTGSSYAQREEIVSIGVLAAKVSIATRRVLADRQLDSRDMAALEAVKRLLQEEVQAFRFASSLGKEGGGPSRVVGNSTAPNAFLALMPSEADAENMQKWLGEVIDQVDLVIERADRNAAEYLTKLFGSLAQWAVQRSGSPGDRIVE